MTLPLHNGVPMKPTIFGLLHSYPHLFNLHQVWYQGEPFTQIPAESVGEREIPTRVVHADLRYATFPLHRAIDLLECYVRDPDNPIWDRYLWTSDTDALGQRVYIGKNNGLLEIHRHIHLTERFGVPVW